MDKERVGAIVIFLFGLGGFYFAGQIPREGITDSSMMPRVVTISIMILAVIMYIQAHLRAREGEDPGPFFHNPINFVITIAACVAYITAVMYLGFFSASVVFVPALAYLLGFRSVKVIAGSTVAFLILVFVVFVGIFERPLPPEWFMTL